ncbi:NADP-dependent oxidoreductase [Cryptosporangium phraense]|uniref:NADP-dependent oxidoreductase n=1 Tax=Cryptosporangium phraense TaxID=2593070 RepID=A0A545AN09_9ACTN|nr:NADP-dependent oxidoreductase [Cryptosporangium phraense]TQS42676.1 NADP-dependent oxidoreductase [Cryptosporangium phraense]
MKAVRYSTYGDPSVLTYEDAPRPAPGEGQVLVRTAATTFNPVDAAIRAGYLRESFPLTLPQIPGIEVAGTIVEIGPGVDRFAAGDAVIGALPMNADGASAEFVVAAAELLAKAPSSVALADAAALPVGALTAQQALFEHADLRAGQRVLINGAGGSVGGFAVQLAGAAGAHVIATASPRSADRVRRYGADEVIDYTTTPVTDVAPVDVVLNLVAAPADALAGLVAPGGVFVSATTPAPESVRSVQMYLRADAAQLAELAAQVDRGALEIFVGDQRPLPELASVHEQAAAGKLPAGKIVLIP